MYKHVVVVRTIIVTPYATEPMPASIIGAGFRNQAPLNGYVFITVQRHYLITAPACRNMVNDNILTELTIYCINLANCRIRPDADKPDDHIIGINPEAAFYANAITRSGLSGDGNFVIPDPEI
jgi:hypothetical protein